MKKKTAAVIAALIMTAILATGMFSIVGNPFSANRVQAASSSTSGSITEQVSSLTLLVNQYQTRETQYQKELKDAAQQISSSKSQLDQANLEVQQLQQVLLQLQSMGVISIQSNGSILVNTSMLQQDGN